MAWYWTVAIIVAGIFCWRTMFRLVWERNERNTDEGEKVFYALFWATFLWWTVPVLAAYTGIVWLFQGDAERFAKAMGGRTKKMREREKDEATKLANANYYEKSARFKKQAERTINK